MRAFLDTLLAFIDGLLAPFMPADMVAQMDFVYDAALVALAAGTVLLVAAVALMIAMLSASKKRGAQQ